MPEALRVNTEPVTNQVPARPTSPTAWELRYRRALLAADAVIVLGSAFSAQLLRFGLSKPSVVVYPTQSTDFTITYSLVSLGLSLVWLFALGIGESRNPKVIGIGTTEYRLVVRMTVHTFGIFAIGAFLLRAEIGRGYLLIALPFGLVLLLLSRWLLRKRLHQQRAQQQNMYRTLLVGERNASAHIAREIRRHSYAGFDLLGAVTQGGRNGELLPGVPVIASYDELLNTVTDLNIDTLIMASPDAMSPEQIRQIGWELEARNVNLIVTVALTDIAGPRIHTCPVAGLPLIHVKHPEFTGPKLLAKRLFDLIGSATLLLLLSPLFLALALIVKTDSPGPALFKQRRVGHDGKEFSMLKFRTMVVDAEEQLDALVAQTEGYGAFFKMKQDPRITKTGAILRKYSLDELPQLVNVLIGDMSLVGPRPQVAREVENYEDWMHRRLLVKPGITGLWQVSGRNDLSPEDSMRLDLYYVENWSMIADLIILWRTVRTVIRPDGAY